MNSSNNPAIHIFLLSWPGFEDATLMIQQSVSMLGYPVSVLYNPRPDSNNLRDSSWTLFPAESRFGAKFEFAISTFKPEIYLFIAADTVTRSWPGLIQACVDAFSQNPSIGVWTPRIENSYWKLAISRIGVEHVAAKLVDVISTDSIVWGISKPIRDELEKLDYTNSKFGWGIDVVSAAVARTRGLRVVCDTSIEVEHRKATTYSVPVADKESHTFYSQLTEQVDSMRRMIEQYAEMQYVLGVTSKPAKILRPLKELVDRVYALARQVF